jgi:hypothetical protein
MAFDANDLSPHEHFVVERTRLGELADFTALGGGDETKPSVRAGFLRKLLMGVDESWIVKAPGVRVRGARIDGALDLTDCSALPALSLDQCEIAEPISLADAEIARVALTQCRLSGVAAQDARIAGALDLTNAAAFGAPGLETLIIAASRIQIGGDLRLSGAKLSRGDSGEPALTLDGAEIGGDVRLDGGFESFGAVSLAHARIGGALIAEGAALLNRSEDAKNHALNARGATFGAGVRIGAKFKAEGECDFAGARIGGDLDFAGATLRNEFGAALIVAHARITGQVLGAARVSGQLQAQGADIGRNLDLRGAEIAHPLTPRADSFGVVIDAAGLRVGGVAFLQGANLKGEVFLADARIASYLALGGGRFINAGGWAIRAPNIRIGGNLTMKIEDGGFAPLGQKTVIEGGAKFDRARIEGAFVWVNLELRGPGPDGAKGGVLSFVDAEIDGPLQARGLVTHQEARINAAGARCASLDDDIKTGWGMESAALNLDGFAYGRLDGADDNRRLRLGWLKRAGRERFSPQPYVQLAAAYARAGRRDDARRVALAQHDAHTARGAGGPLSWALSSLFGVIAGYGLAPLRVMRALALFLALGVFGALAMNAQGALVTPAGAQCNGAVEPALYAIDVALPFIDLGQQGACAPGRTARAELPQGMALGESEWRLFEGVALWRWAHALYAILGAILAALAVLTFSGVLKPKDQ